MENEEPETKEECMKAFYRILPKKWWSIVKRTCMFQTVKNGVTKWVS